jgi:hypothetical protein
MKKNRHARLYACVIINIKTVIIIVIIIIIIIIIDETLGNSSC